MPRRDKDCATRRRKINTLLLALMVPAVIGGAIFLGVIIVNSLAAVGQITEGQAAQEEWAKDATRPSRRQFTAKVTGMTKDEVLAILGKPGKTYELGGHEYWVYYRASRDLVGQGPDTDISLQFGDDGKVALVN